MYCMEEARKRRWMKNLSEQAKKKGKQMRSLWYDVLSIQFGYGLGWLGVVAWIGEPPTGCRPAGLTDCHVGEAQKDRHFEVKREVKELIILPRMTSPKQPKTNVGNRAFE
jgi:hypothetical protein